MSELQNKIDQFGDAIDAKKRFKEQTGYDEEIIKRWCELGGTANLHSTADGFYAAVMGGGGQGENSRRDKKDWKAKVFVGGLVAVAAIAAALAYKNFTGPINNSGNNESTSQPDNSSNNPNNTSESSNDSQNDTSSGSGSPSGGGSDSGSGSSSGAGGGSNAGVSSSGAGKVDGSGQVTIDADGLRSLLKSAGIDISDAKESYQEEGVIDGAKQIGRGVLLDQFGVGGDDESEEGTEQPEPMDGSSTRPGIELNQSEFDRSTEGEPMLARYTPKGRQSVYRTATGGSMKSSFPAASAGQSTSRQRPGSVSQPMQNDSASQFQIQQALLDSIETEIGISTAPVASRSLP